MHDSPAARKRREPEHLEDLVHELNGPLTFLLGYSEMLLESQLDAVETRAAQVEIYREACRLADLVGIVVEATPTRRAQPTSADRIVELRLLLERVAHRWRTAYPLLQLAIECPSDARIAGNRDRIALALHALLGLRIGPSAQSGVSLTLCVVRTTASWCIRLEGPPVAPTRSALTTRLARKAIAAIASSHGGRVRRRGAQLDLHLPAIDAAAVREEGGS